MSEKDDRVATLDLSGSFSDIGEAHGEACRGAIKSLLDARTAILFQEIPDLTAERLETVCRSLWAHVDQGYPDLSAEVTATATSAQVAPWQLVIAGAYTDVLDVCRGRRAATVDECTVALSATDHVIAGTWDTHASAVNSLVLLTRRPKKGPATLALTTAGWPAQQGVNSDGLAFAITNLTPRHSSPKGLPYIAANALLACAHTVDDFVRLATNERFCSGHSYLAVERHGPGMIVETSDEGVDVLAIADEAVKANHYRESSPLDDNAAYPYLDGSRARQGELDALMGRVHSPSSFASSILSSRLVNRTDESGPAVTGAHFYLDAAREELWYRSGPARGEGLVRATL